MIGDDTALIAPLKAMVEGAPPYIFAAAGVFARVGAALFFLPGIGEMAVPMRLRLAIALAIAVVLAPIVAGFAPVAPLTPGTLTIVLIAEAGAGLVIGLSFRLLIHALQIAGTVASQSVTISHLFGNAIAGEAEPSLASFLAMGGVAVALAAGLHVDAVAALATLYDVLPFGLGLAGGPVAEWSTARVGETFALGLGLAIPFVLAGFAYNMALGALSRAMPQLLVALVGVPFLVGLGMAVLWLALPEIFARWLEALAIIADNPLAGPFGRGS
ncbi:MAG: flagellar biosynthetic protein FliR [Pseudomonadota bacterium]